MKTGANRLVVLLGILFVVSNLMAGVKKDWKRAQEQDSIAAYTRFLLKHPNSKFDEEAQRRLLTLEVRRDWYVSKTDGSVTAVTSFLEKYPVSEFTEEASQLLEVERAWTAASAENTSSSYEAFLEKHPNTHYRQVAESRVLEHRWAETRQAGTRESYSAFIKANPKSSHLMEARVRGSLESLTVDVTTKPQLVTVLIPGVEGICPDKELRPRDDHVFVVARWTLSPVSDFKANFLEESKYIDASKSLYSPLARLVGESWRLLDFEARGSELCPNMAYVSVRTTKGTRQWHEGKAQEVEYLFEVPRKKGLGGEVLLYGIRFPANVEVVD